MAAVTIQLGVMKPVLKVSTQPTVRTTVRLRQPVSKTNNIFKAILKPIWIGIYNWFGMESYSGKAHIVETKKDPLYRYAKHLQPSFRYTKYCMTHTV